MKTPDFTKNPDGLIPAIIQDSRTLQVLMLGYMNLAAYDKTIQERRVTFYSRSKERLWTKGETSGNFLAVDTLALDCDSDSILIQAIPDGTICHTGSNSCFGEKSSKGFLYELEQTIAQRLHSDDQKSYTKSLATQGIHKVAQKVGEEATELVIEALREDGEAFVSEAADLLFHTLILLQAKGFSLEQVESELLKRSQKSS